MKSLFLAAAALVILSAGADAATTKAVWNQPIDSPANVAAGATVTAGIPTNCSGTGECRDEKGHGERSHSLQDEEAL